jgi:hypothetical protein
MDVHIAYHSKVVSFNQNTVAFFFGSVVKNIVAGGDDIQRSTSKYCFVLFFGHL